MVLYRSQILSFSSQTPNGSTCSPSGNEKSCSLGTNKASGVDLTCSSKTLRHSPCRKRGSRSKNVHVNSCAFVSHGVAGWWCFGAFCWDQSLPQILDPRVQPYVVFYVPYHAKRSVGV